MDGASVVIVDPTVALGALSEAPSGPSLTMGGPSVVAISPTVALITPMCPQLVPSEPWVVPVWLLLAPG